jgi:hypothetical protein
VLRRLEQVESELGLEQEDVLARYLRVSVTDIRQFKSNPEVYPLPPRGQMSLGVAWRYLALSNAVLGLMPATVRDKARRWERSRARVLAEQRGGGNSGRQGGSR